MNGRAAAKVAVIDAGGANLGSVRHALERLGVEPIVVGDADGLAGADRVVLPGVGAAEPAMARLRERGFDQALRTCNVPVLGICLGMQLLYESSEEGSVDCLGLLPGKVRRMQAAPGARLPHMGWNTLQPLVADSPLLEGIGASDAVYFVHGYAAAVDANTLALTLHGEAFAAIVQHGRYCGMQFHPERSAAAGAALLRNFLRWSP